MTNRASAIDVFRNILWLALLGIAATVLSGPILAVTSVFLAVAGVVLAFAGIGFLIYTPIHWFLHGRESALQRIRSGSRYLAQAVLKVGHGAMHIVAFVPRLLEGLLHGLGMLVSFLWRALWRTLRLTTEMAVLAMVGGGIGAIYMVTMASPAVEHGLPARLPIAVGAGLAVLTGLVITVFDALPRRVRNA